jgi:ribonuclease HI
LELGAGKKIRIYTDSRYAFATAQIHKVIYQERELLTSEEKVIKNKQEILDLLDALMKPATVNIIHCPGH